MKTYFIGVVVGILTIGISCKKDKQEDKPSIQPSQKKWIVTPIVGGGLPGFADGSLLVAEFSGPGDIAVSSDGTLFFTDIYNHRVRKIKDGQ